MYGRFILLQGKLGGNFMHEIYCLFSVGYTDFFFSFRNACRSYFLISA